MKYRCGHCGYEGYCYGTATSQGVSAPWCPRCQKNNKLTLVEKKETMKQLKKQAQTLKNDPQNKYKEFEGAVKLR